VPMGFETRAWVVAGGVLHPVHISCAGSCTGVFNGAYFSDGKGSDDLVFPYECIYREKQERAHWGDVDATLVDLQKPQEGYLHSQSWLLDVQCQPIASHQQSKGLLVYPCQRV